MKSISLYKRVVSGISIVGILLSSSTSSFAGSIEFGDSRAMVHYDDDLPRRSASFTADTIPNPMSGASGGQDTGTSSSGQKSSSGGEIFDGGGNFRPAPPVSLPGNEGRKDGQVFSGSTPFGNGDNANASIGTQGQGASVQNPESYAWHRGDGSSSNQDGASGSQPSGSTNEGQPNDISFDESGMTAGAGAVGDGQHGRNSSGESNAASNDKLYIIPSHKGENTDAAIDEILGNTNAPLSAIEKAKRAADENRRAMAAPAALPKHVSRSLHLTLLNGEERPVIHLMRGNMTTIVFHDITGAKWEYHGESFDKEHFEKLGGSNSASSVSGKAGEEAKPAHGQTNIFCLQPTRSYSMGTNSTVFLDGLDVPVVFILEAGYSGVVDDYVDVTIAKRGPNAKVGYSELGITPDHDNFLQPFVDGVPPQGARKLPTSNDAVEAWMFARKMVIRTPYPLQSGFLARSDQVGGAIAYKVNPHLNFVTVSIDGVITSVEIQR